MAEEAETQEEKVEAPAQPAKGKGKWFRKIPKNVLFSPGGVVLMVTAAIFEVIDVFIPGGALTFEIIPDLIFGALLAIIAKVPAQSLVIPFLVERIPVISDILPTWLIRLFI